MEQGPAVVQVVPGLAAGTWGCGRSEPWWAGAGVEGERGALGAKGCGVCMGGRSMGCRVPTARVVDQGGRGARGRGAVRVRYCGVQNGRSRPWVEGRVAAGAVGYGGPDGMGVKGHGSGEHDGALGVGVRACGQQGPVLGKMVCRPLAGAWADECGLQAKWGHCCGPLLSPDLAGIVHARASLCAVAPPVPRFSLTHLNPLPLLSLTAAVARGRAARAVLWAGAHPGTCLPRQRLPVAGLGGGGRGAEGRRGTLMDA